MTLKGLKASLARATRSRTHNAKLAKQRRHRIKTLTVKVARRPKLAFWLISRHKGLRFASGFRTIAHNQAVGGVPNSWHTKGSVAAPGAVDLVGPLDEMQAAQRDAREHVKGLAENLIHDVGSGLHLHLGGQGVIDFDWPAEAEIRRLKRLRAGNLRNIKLRDKTIKRLKAAIKRAEPVPAKGIDVSMHQGEIDWHKVKASGVDFVWIKSSEGADFKDPTFIRNVRGASQAGLRVGAYHFLRPKAGRSGAAEAGFFFERLKEAGLGKGDLIPVLDIEVTGTAAVAPYARQAYDHLRALTDRPVGIYTFPFFMSSWPSWAKSAPLWIADFGGLSKPRLPKPWTSYAAWQHTDKGTVPGIKGNVDKNLTADVRKLVA